MNVAIVGASDKPERYAYKAMTLLEEKGHRVFPVNPALKMIGGRTVYSAATEIGERIDTVTVYVRQEISSKIAEEILSLKPQRIIFNPGAENPDLAKRAEDEGIDVCDACTLVMLSTGQF